ncbi:MULTISPECIES: DUF4123 domain-containing protein [unclassified Modicisalibacter]|uniref:DUF4123 domain-containing protein n=1 Tax=unclassified Modicisalibacter TaxID=2679913 RepID=UPI001CCE0D28|nr:MULTISPECIES: DUF4123 domain-containing protein [unclassified Modicisalibacter]MBZ9560513.1 DUF4123 domain-containing protein [Modicisalibacter sp. R2A 31.J]MBZ9577356.1 DUF4123 domain-containing protein [Modicisalibacter sp. MOD 31.J]
MSVLREPSRIHAHDEALTPGSLRQFDFAVINPLVVHERDWRDLPVQALETSPAPARAHRLPQLVALQDLPHEVYDDLIARIRRYRKRGVLFFSALMSTRADLNRTAWHLRRQLLQRRPGDRRYHWFRYYDPLVFRHLAWLLTPTQLARLLGPLDRWSWFDGQGQSYVLKRPEITTTIDWLELTRGQWSSIDRFADLNRSLRRLALLAPDWPQDTTHWQWLDDTLRHAQRSGLSPGDQPLLAERAAMHLPGLAGQDLVESFMALATRRLSDTGGHLDAWHDAEWNTLISELRSGHESRR